MAQEVAHFLAVRAPGMRVVTEKVLEVAEVEERKRCIVVDLEVVVDSQG